MFYYIYQVQLQDNFIFHLILWLDSRDICQVDTTEYLPVTGALFASTPRINPMLLLNKWPLLLTSFLRCLTKLHSSLSLNFSIKHTMISMDKTIEKGRVSLLYACASPQQQLFPILITIQIWYVWQFLSEITVAGQVMDVHWLKQTAVTLYARAIIWRILPF